ncbi:unnamed protein product [Cuscuta epithymum]|uniref:Septum-promoting GTP-binding protein 1 n=1 Tax=Cuscuta epithymum TaxID=186058 RepID=A0AAV0DRW3_9ASTE|nr:unnamed protein product [Cuscuta epithymum]
MSHQIHEATGKMTKLCRKIVDFNFRWRLVDRVSYLKDFFRLIWERLLICSTQKPERYRRIAGREGAAPLPESMEVLIEEAPTTAIRCGYESESDLVSLKISILGDSQIGKTSFVTKYVGDDQEMRCLQMDGINFMDKTLIVRGARIALSIWDVGAGEQLPNACNDAVAILFMFDLTSRCTLNSVIGWYSEARKWNQTAIPILIGSKFDDFARLPPDVQSSVITQARAYAKVMKASLFFSSATHNINVNKIFKFIMARVFNLPWNLERNLTIGEPIIDFL